jgi:hypothetical protein
MKGERTMRRIELTGVAQQQAINVHHHKIHELNAALKKAYAEYNDWDNAPEKVKERFGKEEYKVKCIDPLLDIRRYHIKKMHNARMGFTYE